MSFLNPAILFVFGAAVGSFLNVIIYRYRPIFFIFSRKIIGGRSHCPHCGSTLRWFELIPLISFFIQGGRCRRCHVRLSWQYPLVELLSGLIFAVVPYQLPITNYLLIALWLLVFLIWLLIFFIDLRLMIIPNELNFILAVFGFAITAVLAFNSNILPVFTESFLKHYTLIFSPFPGQIILNHIIGALVGGAVFGLIFFLGRGRAMGLGDVKLALASGLALGWPDIGLAIMLSFLFGGGVAFILLISGRRRLQDRIPFGPIFVVAAAATVLWGEKIIAGYFQLFSLPVG